MSSGVKRLPGFKLIMQSRKLCQESFILLDTGTFCDITIRFIINVIRGRILSQLVPTCEQTFRAILSCAQTKIIVLQNSCPSHSYFASRSCTDN